MAGKHPQLLGPWYSTSSLVLLYYGATRARTALQVLVILLAGSGTSWTSAVTLLVATGKLGQPNQVLTVEPVRWLTDYDGYWYHVLASTS